MRIEGETGFVLHARPWRETSLLVEVLSAGHGRIGLVARGVQSPKRQVLRAALQPLQHIRFDAVMAGELAQLRAAEALDAAPQLGGDALLAAFYLNELVLRLAPRQDPLPELDAAYARTRERLRAGVLAYQHLGVLGAEGGDQHAVVAGEAVGQLEAHQRGVPGKATGCSGRKERSTTGAGSPGGGSRSRFDPEGNSSRRPIT